MRYLEVRRHTMRLKPGKHISQEGVNLARRVGESMGVFRRVVTSSLPRAYETAIAMGYAVDESIDELAEMDDAAGEELESATTFAEFAAVIKQNGPAARAARKQAKLWHSIVQTVPDGGSVLAISHGLLIESGVIGCRPDAPLKEWGSICNYCEGVRLSFDGDACVDAVMLRL